jgi:hypothetical protein
MGVTYLLPVTDTAWTMSNILPLAPAIHWVNPVTDIGGIAVKVLPTVPFARDELQLLSAALSGSPAFQGPIPTKLLVVETSLDLVAPQ